MSEVLERVMARVQLEDMSDDLVNKRLELEEKEAEFAKLMKMEVARISSFTSLIKLRARVVSLPVALTSVATNFKERLSSCWNSSRFKS